MLHFISDDYALITAEILTWGLRNYNLLAAYLNINERNQIPNATEPQPIIGPREPALPQEIIPSQTISHEPYAPKDDDTEEKLE